MPGSRHCAATEREDEDGAASAAAEEGGGEEPWSWPRLRWSRHLNDPGWVAGAQTHLTTGPWPWPWAAPDGAEADPGHLLRDVLGDAAEPVGVVLLLWWP